MPEKETSDLNEQVSTLIRKSTEDFPTTSDAQNTIQNSIGELAALDHNRTQGILEKFQVNAVSRKNAKKELEILYDHKLKLVEHTLKHFGDAKKYELAKAAEQLLQEIDATHLENLNRLGIRNLKARQETLLALGDTTTSVLNAIEEKTWPKAMRDQMIESAMAEHLKFLKKVTESEETD